MMASSTLLSKLYPSAMTAFTSSSVDSLRVSITSASVYPLVRRSSMYF